MKKLDPSQFDQRIEKVLNNQGKYDDYQRLKSDLYNNRVIREYLKTVFED